MNNRENLNSYDGVEKVQLTELSEEGIHAYMKLKLESAESNANFVRDHVYRGVPLNVCEIGSGNSKLLYALERDNILWGGTGYEVSASRCRLAEKFAEMLQSKKVKTVNKNFLEDIPNGENFDLVVMVDIVFQIIAPLHDNAERDTMEWVSNALKDGGYLFMEIEDYTEILLEIERSDGSLRRWVEFGEGDPFQYALHLIQKDGDGNLVVKKTHIRRDGGAQDHFRNVIRSYSEEEIQDLLTRSGFSVQIFPGEFELGEYRGTKRFRVLAQKVGVK